MFSSLCYLLQEAEEVLLMGVVLEKVSEDIGPLEHQAALGEALGGVLHKLDVPPLPLRRPRRDFLHLARRTVAVLPVQLARRVVVHVPARDTNALRTKENIRS